MAWMGLTCACARHGQTGLENPSVDGNHIFNAQRMAGAVETANQITNTYGVTIVSINIISATPADRNLQASASCLMKCKELYLKEKCTD